MTGYLGLHEPLKSLGTDVPTLIALLVCLIPTTIGALLAAIGIAGMDRALQANIIAKSGKAVELAGDIDVVLLDKTGTITLGNRHATKFLPIGDVLADGARPAGGAGLGRRRDARGQEHRRACAKKLRQSRRMQAPDGADVRAVHRADAHERRRSAGRRPDPQRRLRRDRRLTSRAQGGVVPGELQTVGRTASPRRARRPWSWPRATTVAGVIVLEDILKPGMKERFAQPAQDGPADRHDHRRQPADRGGHRRAGGRRRFPRPGDARDEARLSSARSRPRASSSP